MIDRLPEPSHTETLERTKAGSKTWAVTPDLMGALNSEGYFVTSNPAWFMVLGWTEEEVASMSIWELLHPDDVENTKAGFALTQIGQPTIRFPNRYRHKNGTYRSISWVGVPEDGYVYCTGRDITDDADNQRTLAETIADRDRMWENSQDINVVINEDGTFLAVNPATTKILGWPAEEMIGRTVFEFIVPDDDELTQKALETATVGELPIVENRYRHKDGGFRWISWVAAPYEHRIYATGRHITAEKDASQQLAAAQEALRQAQKMEAVGQLTGGIAHDFNNIIAGVSGSLELMSIRLAQGRLSEVERYLTAASGATRRAAALTQRLLAFSRRQTLDPKPVNVNGLIDGMLELINRSVGPEIAVETVGKAGLWNTFVDPGQLESALLNLCINARDAMPDGGKITVESANRWMDDRAARERGLSPGQYVSLCISDTGSGMPKDVVERAFDPFFTTKPIGQGTGLGLSMVHGFAGQSGGTVRIYSETGQGTMVCIYLPRHVGDEAHDPVQGETIEVPVVVGGPVLLLVDDEPLIRMVAAEHLEDLGYTVLEAGDANEALQVLEGNEAIALLITDVGLPGGMNGRQLAEVVRQKRPELDVLFITGYAENAVFNHGHLERGMHMMGKPFQMDAFAAKVSELVSRH